MHAGSLICYIAVSLVVAFDLVDIRLVDGPDGISGRVEIKHEGVWGTVCDDDFGAEEAQVICKSLGCQ